jgi:hypothetical protein
MGGDWYLMPYDEMLARAEADGVTQTASWIEGGSYSRPRPSAALVAQCAPYRFAPIWSPMKRPSSNSHRRVGPFSRFKPSQSPLILRRGRSAAIEFPLGTCGLKKYISGGRRPSVSGGPHDELPLHRVVEAAHRNAKALWRKVEGSVRISIDPDLRAIMRAAGDFQPDEVR